MIFSSLFFIFLFLPANLLAYYIPKKIDTKNTVMLIFSLIFYAWGEPKYVFLLLFLSFTSWFFALQTEKYKSENPKKAKLMTALG
ncbi:MAG: MBOAT family protein, partial [Clostridiales bacterium]|nr:MBOAT family protein [Clostridiales bacterium]